MKVHRRGMINHFVVSSESKRTRQCNTSRGNALAQARLKTLRSRAAHDFDHRVPNVMSFLLLGSLAAPLSMGLGVVKVLIEDT